jgi:uncharacterized Ntn-hydrolase superfamily protein
VTYSIVARDPRTGELGGAVQSHWFSVGSVVLWGEPGVGIVATQALVETSYGPMALDLMREAKPAAEALAELTAADEGREHRQVAVVDASGTVASHTGASCIPEAGHRSGDGFSVQANMMWNDTVWDAMHEAFLASDGDITSRLLVALDAAQAEGGDIRGKQSSAILVVRPEPSGKPWEDTTFNLRVEDHPEPLVELRRLVDLQRAYDHLEEGEELQVQGREEESRTATAAALGSPVRNTEVLFWGAIALAGEGRVEEAAGIIRPALDEHPGWAELLDRMSDRGLLDIPRQVVERLLRG